MPGYNGGHTDEIRGRGVVLIKLKCGEEMAMEERGSGKSSMLGSLPR